MINSAEAMFHVAQAMVSPVVFVLLVALILALLVAIFVYWLAVSDNIKYNEKIQDGLWEMARFRFGTIYGKPGESLDASKQKPEELLLRRP